MSLFRRYRHLRRLEKILRVIWRYGFGYLIDQTGILSHFPLKMIKARTAKGLEGLSRGERLRLALTELGPAFIKLGQILSTRYELLPEDIILQLQKLQDDVEPFSFDEAKSQIEAEFRLPLEEVFASFDPQPMASASIGQVHGAALQSGRDVVVKVQRPGIRKIIETDLEILFDLARIVEQRTSWGQLYGLQDMMEEFAGTIRREMDYTLEGRNADRIRRSLSGDERVYVPKIYWDYTTQRILTMEHVGGAKLTDKGGLARMGVERQEVARVLTRSVVRQALVHGYFHADPHPGNIKVMSNGRLALLDFGMASSLTEGQRSFFISLIWAIVRGNSRKIMRGLLEIGSPAAEVDERKLLAEIERLRDKYYDLPLKDLKLGESISELHKLAYKYKIRFPSEFTVVSKAVLTLEGTISYLTPEISFLEIIEPMERELFQERISRRQVRRWLTENLPSYGEMLVEIPERLHSFLGRLEKNQARLTLEFKETEKILHRMERTGNRLSFSMVLLSFSIIMMGLMVAESIRNVSLFGNIPVLELGYLAAGAMTFWLIYSIIRSGRI